MNSQEEIKISIEDNLKKYVPDLFKLMDSQDISWTSINKGYLKIRNDRKKSPKKIQQKNLKLIFMT